MWLHISGLSLRPAAGNNVLWDATGGADLRNFTPEHVYDAWIRNKSEWLQKYKLARIFGSGLDQVAKFAPRQRAEQLLGLAMMMSMGMVDQEIAWLRFQRMGTDGKHSVGVYGGLRTIEGSAEDGQTLGNLGGRSGIGDSLTRGDLHRGLVYLQSKIMANAMLKRFGPRMMSSLVAFEWCFTAEASGLPPADARKLIKLFSAYTGTPATPSGTAWQRGDRTWNMLDTRNWRGELQEQGRLLWEGRWDEKAKEGVGYPNRKKQVGSKLRSCAAYVSFMCVSN